MARPFTDPANIGLNGQPIMNETAWALSEAALDTEANDAGWGVALARALDARATREDLLLAVKQMSAALDARAKQSDLTYAVKTLLAALDNKASLDAVKTLTRFAQETRISPNDLATAVSAIMARVDVTQAALLALCTKLDDDATVTDTDYEELVSGVLT